jgi:protein-tyrosine-phosphatase
MKTILFACVHNAGRSQIAAAWFNALSARCQREKEEEHNSPTVAEHRASDGITERAEPTDHVEHGT